MAAALTGVLLLSGCTAGKEPDPSHLISADEKHAYRIAILNDEANVANGTDEAGLAAFLEGRLGELGYSVQTVSFDQLCEPSTLTPERFDCLIMPDSVHYPVGAAESIRRFTEKGGDLMLLGGHAFSVPMAFSDQKWSPCAEEDNPHLDRLLGVFDKYEVYEMPAVATTAFYKEQACVTPFTCAIDGDFDGVSAIGFETPDNSSFIPVLEALDADGIRRGWACGVLTHYVGSAGSDWMLSGISQDGFYRDDDFIRLADYLLSHFYLGTFHEYAKAENEARLAGKVEPLSSADKPMGIRLTADGLGFEYEDGTPFFAVGANIVNRGSFTQHYIGSFKPALVEEDFRRLKAAGVNLVRIYGFYDYIDDVAYIETVKNCASKYGVYLLLEISYRNASTLEELRERGRRISAVFKDDPMVLGYDLQNEPYYWDLNNVTDEAGIALADRYPFGGDFAEYAEYAGLDLSGESWSTFPRVNGPLPTPQNSRQNQGLKSVNGILNAFIQAMTDGIRENDSTHLITVGYNTPYVFMPCNESLDFISNHVYENLHTVTDYDTILTNITAMDRLRSVYDKPIVIGEFNVSNGEKGDGTYYDVHNSGVAEFIHYIYAYAGGYSGVMKWSLTDWPLFNIEMETSAWWQGDETWISEGRMGMFLYDGTKEGEAKPIAHALKFLSDYITGTRAADRGSVRLTVNDSLIGTGYVFEADGALFVGDVGYRSDRLSFTSTDDKPANVMLRWTSDRLTIMATHDCEVSVRLSDFLPAAKGNVKITGKYKDLRQEQGTVTLTLFAGQVVEME